MKADEIRVAEAPATNYNRNQTGDELGSAPVWSDVMSCSLSLWWLALRNLEIVCGNATLTS